MEVEGNNAPDGKGEVAAFCGDSLDFKLLGYLAAVALNLLDHALVLGELVAHELDGALEDEAFGAALTFETGNEFGEAVEAFADGLSSFLFCRVSEGTLLVSFLWNGMAAYVACVGELQVHVGVAQIRLG